MKKILFTILLAGLATLTFSQNEETALKKDIISIDIGFLGVRLNYERHLGGLFTLKSTFGLEGGFGRGFVSNGESYYAFTPTVIVEPRYYYNFDRRVRSGKKTSYNASNYFAFAATYFPNLFTISNISGLGIEPGISLIPKWGIKRTVGQRMNFEFALGTGPFFSKTGTGLALGLDLRFGYNIR